MRCKTIAERSTALLHECVGPVIIGSILVPGSTGPDPVETGLSIIETYLSRWTVEQQSTLVDLQL